MNGNQKETHNLPSEDDPQMIRASELIHEIASDIVNDENFSNADWESLAVVFTAYEGGGASSITGFYYDAKNNATPEIPEADLTDKFLELRSAMQLAHGCEWKSALVQITRATKKVSTQFEYDDEDRWKITPANLDSMRKELRPKSET